jgi:hypothetical protein
MFKINKILIWAGVLLLVQGVAVAQDNVFSDPNVEYTFALPDPAWKMISKPSVTNPNVGYVFNDRHEAIFEIRKLTVAKDAFMSDVIRDEEQKLQFLPGYVRASREENFSGNFRGNVFNYEFVRSGRNMSGRFYFLRANETIVYVLRFTGQRDTLRSIRNQTDSIARTFALKKA